MYAEVFINKFTIVISRTTPLSQEAKESLLKNLRLDVCRLRGRHTSDQDWSFTEEGNQLIISSVVGKWVEEITDFYDSLKKSFLDFFHSSSRDLCNAIEDFNNIQVSYDAHYDSYSEEDYWLWKEVH